jgi:hypothetical protein
MNMKRVLCGIAMLSVLVFAAVAVRVPSPSGSPKPGGARRKKLIQDYGKLPIRFEANWGQTNSRVNYLARGAGYTLFLTRKGMVLALAQRGPEQGRISRAKFAGPATAAPSRVSVLRMRLVSANRAAKIAPLDELPGSVNYFIGSDPRNWRTNAPTYRKVKYSGVYPGVDLIYYGNQGQLEYDFVMAPGADPRAIRLAIETGDSKAGNRNRQVRIAANGELIVETDGGEVRFRKPLIYQPAADSAASRAGGRATRQYVAGRFALLAENQIGFAIGPYDHSKPLIIDPRLVYSSYLGGSGADYGYGIAVDSSGNAYVAGKTSSTNFPTAGAYQSSGTTFPVAFVTKINAAGNAVVYSTYLGEQSAASGIAVDSSGDAYVTGGGSGIPTTPGAFQTQAASGAAFVVKLAAAGNQVIYGTYLGDSVTSGDGIAVDSSDEAAITGTTASQSLPTANAIKSQCPSCSPNGPAGQNAFVTKFNAAGSALVFSTYLGGNTTTAGSGVAVDSTGNVYATGYTAAADFPTTPGSWQSSFGGGTQHAYVTKFSPTGSLVYSTYLGGSGADRGYAIAVDSSGGAYVTGNTQSADFPTLNAFQSTYSAQKQANGYDSAFVTKLNASGSALVYSTYLEGSSSDSGFAVAVDSSGDAYVAGATSSSDFPTANAVQSTYGGSEDGFLTELAPAGNSLVFSTYLGGSGQDIAYGVAVDSADNAYATGYTQSTNFPKANPLQAAYGGAGDAFVAKIGSHRPSGSGSSGAGLHPVTGGGRWCKCKTPSIRRVLPAVRFQ